MKLKKEDILHLNANTDNFKKADDLRKNQTSAEKLLWDTLRSRRLNGIKFRRQHPVLRFIADFYCYEANLIVELDGEIHNEISTLEHDDGRTYELNNYGIHVIRFTNEEIINNLKDVLDRINNEVMYLMKQKELL